jgi:3-isopropylmalate/(R)-2-methylmalate dehydratase small subunit
VSASRADLEKLVTAIQNDPALPLVVDLLEMKIHLGQDRIPIKMPESARKALTTGQYDFLAQLLEGEPAIRQTAQKLPYLNQFV